MAALNLSISPLLDAKRIVIKIGSALLVDSEGNGLRSEWLAGFAKDVAMLREQGKDVIVVSSGSIALGRQVLGLGNGPLALKQSQASAAVGQIALAQAYQSALSVHSVTTAQVLLTSEDSENRRRYLNTQATLGALLGMGVVPIINENDTVATDEIRFGDNDRLAAQVSVMAGADVLVLLSDVDGIYTANPKSDLDAKHLPLITEITAELEAMASGAGSATSKGGMITKLMAAQTAMRGGVAMAIAIGEVDQPINAILSGAKVSWFQPKTDPNHARKNWIMAMRPRGTITLDAGAIKALLGGSSLLAIGCKAIIGQFDRGDAVEIIDETGHLVARGLSGYDHLEASKIIGVRSDHIETKLGYAGRGAMVHRDNLIIL